MLGMAFQAVSVDKLDISHMFAPERRAEVADGVLKHLNADYLRAREAGVTKAPDVRVLEPETHLLYRDRKMFFERTAPDQIKPVRSLDTEEKRRIFTTLTIDEGGFRLGDDV